MEQDGLGIEIFIGSVTSEFKYFYELNKRLKRLLNLQDCFCLTARCIWHL